MTTLTCTQASSETEIVSGSYTTKQIVDFAVTALNESLRHVEVLTEHYEMLTASLRHKGIPVPNRLVQSKRNLDQKYQSLFVSAKTLVPAIYDGTTRESFFRDFLTAGNAVVAAITEMVASIKRYQNFR